MARRFLTSPRRVFVRLCLSPTSHCFGICSLDRKSIVAIFPQRWHGPRPTATSNHPLLPPSMTKQRMVSELRPHKSFHWMTTCVPPGSPFDQAHSVNIRYTHFCVVCAQRKCASSVSFFVSEDGERDRSQEAVAMGPLSSCHCREN